VYTLPISQAVVYTNDGQPAALAYEREGLIVTADVTQDGFRDMLQCLCIGKLKLND
jgi:hypothetical protein